MLRQWERVHKGVGMGGFIGMERGAVCGEFAILLLNTMGLQWKVFIRYGENVKKQKRFMGKNMALLNLCFAVTRREMNGLISLFSGASTKFSLF